MRVYHLKGTQFPIPIIFRCWDKPEHIVWEFEFSERAWYEQPDAVEQKDWLKLFGETFTWTDAMKESAMGSWRCNTETQRFEFGAYFHVNSGREMSEPLFTLPRRGGKFTGSIHTDYDRKIYTVNYLDGSKGCKFYHDYTLAREVNSWAGGTLNMPKTIWYNKKLISVN